MLIRDATAADLPAILTIYNQAVENSTATAEYYPHTLDMRQQWFAEHRDAGLPVLVADAGSQVVGWSSLSRFHSRYGYRYTAEDSVYIAEAWRGQGLGRQLVEPLVTLAPALGLHTLISSIDSANTASIRLHMSLGFEQVAYLKEVIYKFDRWLDCIYLQYMVAPRGPAS